jgi:sugar lactone lactonase YvrE
MVGYKGDNAAATFATLANPRGVAYDASGNQYIADALNHVVREISTTGTITTVAGTGIEGYGGDSGPATAALLDMPTGVAVDASGNLYIADSHNHRIREVSNGTITTLAGNGTPGFSGDGGLASAAQLSLPTAVAVDSSGAIYIADTNNQRVREIRRGTITTIAGNGEEFFAGDGAAATSAVLDTPTGVAVDAAGNVYIADRHNQRVREAPRRVSRAATGEMALRRGVPHWQTQREWRWTLRGMCISQTPGISGFGRSVAASLRRWWDQGSKARPGKGTSPQALI